MAISSGRHRIKKMTNAEEYFGVGEIFEYSPISEPDTSVLVEVVDGHGSFSSMADCGCDLCDLNRWCNTPSNRVMIEGKMWPYTPNCRSLSRSDEKDVYFKVI